MISVNFRNLILLLVQASQKSISQNMILIIKTYDILTFT